MLAVVRRDANSNPRRRVPQPDRTQTRVWIKFAAYANYRQGEFTKTSSAAPDRPSPTWMGSSQVRSRRRSCRRRGSPKKDQHFDFWLASICLPSHGPVGFLFLDLVQRVPLGRFGLVAEG
jgi:hypothetical protein